MNNRKHVILSREVYDNLLNYLGTTQIFNNVYKLVNETSRDVIANSKEYKVVAVSPEPAKEVEPNKSEDK